MPPDSTRNGGTDRPNVIVLLTDDQGYCDLGCHGNPTVETPAMDRLHHRSARLEQFHVGTTCAPTRAQLMTGRHKLRAGVWHTIAGRSLLAREETTLAECFAASGYRTGIFGKWHLGDNYPYRPGDRGFQSVFVHGGGGIAQTPDYWGNDYFDDTYFRGSGRDPDPVEGYCTDVWFDEAIGFLEDAIDDGDRFFCYLPTNAPHGPTRVPDRYRERYTDAVDDHLARFYGMITNIDDNLARLRERLRELGVAEETVVLFAGDNGTIGAAADHYGAGMRGSKGSQYEGGHRVHGFVHWPGRIEDRTVERVTRATDVLPTLVDLCGLEPPDAPLDGRSLVPLLTDDPPGTGREWPDRPRTHVVDTQRVASPEKWRNCAVLHGRWRLIDGEELYDVDADPGQTVDVADDHPEVVAGLREHYESFWDGLGDRLDEVARIPVGGDVPAPVTLTAHDWHGASSTPWNQVDVLGAPVASGHWAIEVASGGRYRVDLRRWPPECGTPIDDVPDGFERVDYGADAETHWTGTATAITPVEARLTVDGDERSRPVPDGAESVGFDVDLPAGPARLGTRFLDPDGTERGAYYVSVAPVGD